MTGSGSRRAFSREAGFDGICDLSIVGAPRSETNRGGGPTVGRPPAGREVHSGICQNSGRHSRPEPRRAAGGDRGIRHGRSLARGHPAHRRQVRAPDRWRAGGRPGSQDRDYRPPFRRGLRHRGDRRGGRRRGAAHGGFPDIRHPGPARGLSAGPAPVLHPRKARAGRDDVQRPLQPGFGTPPRLRAHDRRGQVRRDRLELPARRGGRRHQAAFQRQRSVHDRRPAPRDRPPGQHRRGLARGRTLEGSPPARGLGRGRHEHVPSRGHRVAVGQPARVQHGDSRYRRLSRPPTRIPTRALRRRGSWAT